MAEDVRPVHRDVVLPDEVATSAAELRYIASVYQAPTLGEESLVLDADRPWR